MRRDTPAGRDLGLPEPTAIETTVSLAGEVRDTELAPRDNPVTLPSGVVYQLRSLMRLSSPKVRATYEDEIRDIANSGVRPVVSFINHKSGTKTTTALQFASMVSMLTGWRVYVLPATLNTKTATLGGMAGIADGTSIRELSDMVQAGKIVGYQSLSAVSSFTRAPHNVGIFTEDLSSNMAEEASSKKLKYGTPEFQQLMQTLYDKADMWVLDHGNDDVERGSIGLAAVQMSDAVVLPALRSAPYSVNSAKLTFNDYQPDAYDGLTADGIVQRLGEGLNVLPGELVGTRDKLSRATLIMSGVNRYSQEEFGKLIAPTDSRQHVSQRQHPLTWAGTGLPMPSDRYIRQDGWVCDLARLGPRTYDGVLALAVATLRSAAETQAVANDRLVAMQEDIQARCLNVTGNPSVSTQPEGAVRRLDQPHASA